MKRSFNERLWDVALVGLPFAVFKMAAGWVLLDHVGPGLGVLVFAWGAADALLNLISLPRPNWVGHCLLSNTGRLIDRRRKRWENIFLAGDTLLSFVIVAAMIWFGLLDQLPPLLGRLWDAAVVGNVIGAGVGQLWREVRAAGQAGVTP